MSGRGSHSRGSRGQFGNKHGRGDFRRNRNVYRHQDDDGDQNVSQGTFSDVRQKRMAGAVEGLSIPYPPRSGRREAESDNIFNEFARALEVHTKT